MELLGRRIELGALIKLVDGNLDTLPVSILLRDFYCSYVVDNNELL